jgi:hypothetical protein
MNYSHSHLIRRLWELVESHAFALRELNDDAIVPWLMAQIETQGGVNRDDRCALQEYLTLRTCLIRDMVEPPVW